MKKAGGKKKDPKEEVKLSAEDEAKAQEAAAAEAEAKAAAEALAAKENAEREKFENNVARVKFSKPKVKHIVSKHSGSILASEEPRPPLDGALAQAATKVFDELRSEEGENGFDKHSIPELLVKIGFQANQDMIAEHVERLYGGPDQLSIEDLLMFLEKFHAPQYYFGQRLRKFASRNQLQEVAELLARNCDANAGDGEGLTSLHYCCEYNRPEIIELFSRAVGDKLVVNAQDRYGWTPLHCAAHQGNKDCVQLLLDLGANVGIVNKAGKTALHAAVAQNRGLIADMLLSAGADLNLQDGGGMTALHEASYRGNPTLFNDLARRSEADLEVQDVLGNVPPSYTEEEKGAESPLSPNTSSKPMSASSKLRK